MSVSQAWEMWEGAVQGRWDEPSYSGSRSSATLLPTVASLPHKTTGVGVDREDMFQRVSGGSIARQQFESRT